MDAAVWALLMIGGLVVLGLLGLAVLAERPSAPGPDPETLRAEADELAAHAATAQLAAGRAAAVAVGARAAVAAAERAREEAWAAQEAAERAYEVAWRAAVEGRPAPDGAPATPSDGATAEEEADREREVSRAALSAYRRGDISVQELREAWRLTADRDPAQEERERIADRCRIDQAAARRVYDRAAAAARRAHQAARVAEVAAQALVDEAAQAAVEAHEALLAASRPVSRRARLTRRKRPR